MGRALRYLAPNLITAGGIVLGLLSIEATCFGRYDAAAWFILFAVMTDRLDGLAARLLKASTDMGVQLDSLADLITFGLAPALLVYFSLASSPELPFQDGGGRALLFAAAAIWVLAACFRLARYNIRPADANPKKPRIFFGVPTTLAAGVFAVWYLCLLKYSPDNGALMQINTDEVRLLGSWHTPDKAWYGFPIYLFVGGFLMASNLRMPKLGLMRSKLATIFVLTNVALCCGGTIVHMYPDYIVWPPTAWILLFLVWGQVSPTARALEAPALFPRTDPPARELPFRPEDDMLEEEEMGDDDLVF